MRQFHPRNKVYRVSDEIKCASKGGIVSHLWLSLIILLTLYGKLSDIYA